VAEERERAPITPTITARATARIRDKLAVLPRGRLSIRRYGLEPAPPAGFVEPCLPTLASALLILLGIAVLFGFLLLLSLFAV
jgi:hypothetical protein